MEETEKIMANADQYTDVAIKYLMEHGPSVLGAIVVLFIGLKVAKYIAGFVRKMMLKSKMDASLIPFLSGIIGTVLKVLVVISVMGMVGVEMTSFIALIGAAGLAVGMALSGTLQNFAGGVMILVFKPYKPGDFIDAMGFMGVVNRVEIFNTVLTTVDNRRIIIPNGGLSTSAITNFSAEETRRVDFSFGIGYGDDIDTARKIILEEISKISQVLNDPAPMVVVGELADSSVNLTTRVWVNAADYWDVNFGLLENVKKAFDNQGISIPFPQTDVHLFQEK